MSQTYFNEEEVILSVMDYNYQAAGDKETFNVAYGIDKNFLYGCGVSIASILLSNQHAALTFHVFTDHFSDDDRRKFDALAKQYGSRIVVCLVDCEKLKSLPSTKNWTYATYFRFIIADYFSGKIDKLLYLDADIACKGSLQELIALSFDENEIAAVVAEGDIEWWTKRSLSLTTPGLVKGYFNAGFLLINLNAWFAGNISSRAIDMLRDPEIVRKITHLDQDVLNILLVDKARFIDRKFNTQYSINYALNDKVLNPVTDATVFIHYIGPTKPWHEWATYPVSESFLEAKSRSPWKNEQLLKPANSNQYRYSAKHMFRQGKIIKGTLNYFMYFFNKIIK